jgi:ATP/maltotriose-dependent transcriptional regulator MalT
MRLADTACVDAATRREILVRYRVRTPEIEEVAARTRRVEATADEATSRGRWAELDLTSRELEVLQLIADGFGNREIAHQLVIADETVKSHLRNLFDKLDTRSRSHAVAVCLRHGLIS